MVVNQNRLNEFREFFSKELKEAGIIGGAFVFSKSGSSLIEIDYGFANRERGHLVDQNTIFHWASNTKTLTGIAILQLRDDGMLSLDDAVTDYLPEISSIRNPFGSIDDITIRHLMNHSSGLRNPTYPYKLSLPSEQFEPTDYSQLEATFPVTELLFYPGDRFGYSNLGIVFLGRIIEKLSGDEYEVYIDKRIFKPLGMLRSYFDTTPVELLKNRSHSYYREGGNLREGWFDADTGITASNGGLNSTVSDMIRYFDFLVGNNSNGGTILSRDSLLEMLEPSIESDTDANGYRGLTSGVGLTFFFDRDGDEMFFGHGGDQNGFISYTEFNLKRKSFSIIVFNTTVVSSSQNDGQDDVVMKLRRATRKLHQSF